MRKFIYSLLLMAALPAAAQTPLTAAEFDAYTRGKTLYFFNNGSPYGVERYFANKRVQWSFLDGECKDGIWYQQEQFICFEYEGTPTPQCWLFFKENGNLIASFEGDPDNTVLYEATNAEDEMLCLGPKIGV